MDTCVRAFSVDAARTLTDTIKLSVDPDDFILENDSDDRDTKMSNGVQLFRKTNSDEETEVDVKGSRKLALRPQSNGLLETIRIRKLDPGYRYRVVLQMANAVSETF